VQFDFYHRMMLGKDGDDILIGEALGLNFAYEGS
jgi:hypothetical protein